MIEPLLDLLKELGWAQTLSVGLVIANIVQWRLYVRLQRAFAKQNEIINDLQQRRIEDFERVLALATLCGERDEAQRNRGEAGTPRSASQEGGQGDCPQEERQP